jgi:hypothetical protein
MFKHRNSGKNRRKISDFFFENWPSAYKVLICVKKHSKLSHACVTLSNIISELRCLTLDKDRIGAQNFLQNSFIFGGLLDFYFGR